MEHASCRRVDAPLHPAGPRRGHRRLPTERTASTRATTGGGGPRTTLVARLSAHAPSGTAPIVAAARHGDPGDGSFDDPLDRHEFEYLYGSPSGRRRRIPRRSRLRLFTATIVARDGGVIIQAFHASMAINRTEVLHKLEARYGIDLALHADIRPGFRPASPLVLALVPLAVSDLIKQVEHDSTGSHRRGFMIDNMLFIRA